MKEKTKDVMERLIELIKDDQQLHDAVVRMINAQAEATEIRNIKLKARKIP